MYRHCNTEEGARRQRQLEQCLLELMHTQPYPHITIGDICGHAGISRKSFYRYFGSKDGCLHALIDHAIMDSAAYYLPGDTSPSAQHGGFEQFFTYWQKQAPLLDALYRNNLVNCLIERMVRYILEEEPGFRSYLDPGSSGSYEQVLFVVTGTMGLVISWHLTGYQKSASQMAAVLARLVHRPE